VRFALGVRAPKGVRMPRHTRPRTNPGPAPQPSESASPAPDLKDDQVARWAELIADGRDTFPDGLPSPQRERLLAAVRQRLRGRLVRLIARAIAARLRRAPAPDREDPTDA
jgi:hypothetical protein